MRPSDDSNIGAEEPEAFAGNSSRDDYAGSYRVSPHELAEAIRSVQRRRDVEARRRSNTIALADAVKQLDIDITPSQLLDEVEAIRAAERPDRRPRQTRANHAAMRMAVAVALMAMLGYSLQIYGVNRAQLDAELRADAIRRAANVPDTLSGMVMESTEQIQVQLVPPEDTDQTNNGTIAQFGAQPGQSVTSIGALQDGESADCPFAALQALASGDPGASVYGQTSGTGEDRLWTVTARNGSYVVHAFGITDDKIRMRDGQPVRLYASPHGGLDEIKMLLPISMFQRATLVDEPNFCGAMFYGSGATFHANW